MGVLVNEAIVDHLYPRCRSSGYQGGRRSGNNARKDDAGGKKRRLPSTQVEDPNVCRPVRKCVVLWARPDQTEAGQVGEESMIRDVVERACTRR